MFLYGSEHKLCSSLLCHSICENLVTWSPDLRKTGKCKSYFAGVGKRGVHYTSLKLEMGSITRNKRKWTQKEN